jgi:CubicO group peptidase (beta-lactamase class C family)
MLVRRLAVVPLLALFACAAPSVAIPPPRVASSPAPSFRDPARRTKIAAATPKLDALFADVAKKQHLPGLAVGLVADGDLVWSKGYGVKDTTTNAPVDADTVFRIGSITKTFTAVAALQLRDAGRLSFDAPAAKWLPDLGGVLYPTADSTPITVGELLSHSSGLPRLGAFDYTNAKHGPTEEEIRATLKSFPLQYVPAHGEEYSNLGFALAGLVVGHAAQMPYRDYVTSYLLRPLGMASTVWDEESVPRDRLATAYAPGEKDAMPVRKEHWRLGASEGAGGLYSSVRDMARWATFHLQAEPPRDDPDAWPVKRSSLREAMTTHVSGRFAVRATSPVAASAWGIGFGWNTIVDCDLELVTKNGGTEGYVSNVTMLPDRGVAIVLLANLAGADLDHAASDALHLLVKEASLAPRALGASPALVEARERLSRLYDRWNDADAQALLGHEFDEVGGPAGLRQDNDASRAVLGACGRFAGDIDAQSPLHARWALACERGSLEVEAQLTSLSPVRLSGLMQTPVVTPSAALGAIATRIAGLSEAWDDATYDGLLYPAFEKDEIKPFFGKIGRDAGACKVDRSLKGNGTTEGTWRLACAKVPLDLELSLDAKTGHVAHLLIVPAKADARCPR